MILNLAKLFGGTVKTRGTTSIQLAADCGELLGGLKIFSLFSLYHQSFTEPRISIGAAVPFDTENST
jgi:hypothetical protein